jgi:RNA polymerase sigma-70 factor (ECF subfamily)
MTVEEKEQIFLQWQREHRGIVLKVARSYAASKGDQEDLAQAILIQLWQSVDRFENQAKPSTWIYRVALNSAMAWQRGERRRRHRIARMVELDAYWLKAEGPESELLNRLYESIDIADVIGISESNVGVRINRVKKRLTELCNKGSDS